MTTRGSVRTLLAWVLVPLAVAVGCGGGAEEPATTAGGDAGEMIDEVAIAEFEFDPPTITVDAGTDVTWKNRDQAAHTASAVDGSFDTGTLDRGDRGTVTLESPGSHAYVCEFHPFMKGTIEVR